MKADRGTENSLLNGIHPTLRDKHNDSLPGPKSFMYGRSTVNQRIEAFWGQLKKRFAKYYINYFKDMIDEGIFDNMSYLHIDCLKFCLMEIIQRKLDTITKEWNLHYIRKQSESDVPHGKPDITYNFTHLYSTENTRQQSISKRLINSKKFIVQIFQT